MSRFFNKKIYHFTYSLLILILPLLAFLVPSNRLEAFNFTPMNVEFKPSGPGATQSFFAKNPSDKPIAVQITMAERAPDIDNNETFPEVQDKFQVVPNQLVLMPGGEQTIQITWVGDPNPAKELHYRVIAEQLPISLEDPEKKSKAEGGLEVLLKYVAAIYIVPERELVPNLAVASAKGDFSNEEAPVLEVILQNTGDRHVIVDKTRLTITPIIDGKPDPSKSVQITEEDPKAAMLKKVNLLTGLQRRVKIAWPENLPKGDVEVSAEFGY
jgi:fimbrial chaperone protein